VSGELLLLWAFFFVRGYGGWEKKREARDFGETFLWSKNRGEAVRGKCQ